MYEKTFGLRERPFGVTPDPRAYYTNRGYAEAEANLLYGIRERRGFVLLTGEVGTGKTTVLRRVMERLSGEIPFVLVFHTNLCFEEILAFICHELDVAAAAPNRLAQIEALNAFLLEQTRNGRTTALFIDEAQNLTDEAIEAIRLLSNLETGGEKLLQIVLAGQPELEARLDSPELRQLRQRIALRCHLNRLAPGEVGRYVRRRLQCAGAERVDLFAPDAIARISFYSKGVPRLINMICDNALLIAYAGSRRTVGGDVIAEAADDLRLREPSAGPREDLLGLEGALQRVERSIASKPPPAPPKSRHRTWSILLVSLFVTALLMAASSFREDRSAGRWTSGAADARGLLGGEAGVEAPDDTLDPRADSPAHADEAASRSSLDEAAPKAEESSSEPEPEQSSAAPPSDGTTPSNLVYAVPWGATAYQIAGAAYGSWCQLGLDLMEEANPGIEDLDRLAAGQRLQLPPLGRETLLRRVSDGTAEIVLASYASPAAAERFATLALQRSGYDVRVARRRVSGRVLAYRVAMVGLPDAETERAWGVATEQSLLPADTAPFPDGPPPRERVRRAKCVASRLIASR